LNSLLASDPESTAAGEGKLPPQALPEPVSQGRLVLRKFLHHKLAMISAVALVVLVLVVMIMPLFWPHNYEDSGFPSFAQFSLLIALTVSIVSTVVGVVLGAMAGYLRGFADSAISRFTDLFLIVPQIAAAAILVKVFSGSWYVVALVLASFGWMQIARISRAEAMSLSQREFVEAARAAGAGTSRIIFRHLVPNMIGSITVNATLAVAQAVLAEAALSFIGLGVQLPDTSLGKVILDNYTQLTGRPWLFFGPFVVLVLISLSINFIGDGLRDAFDPRQRRMKA
jgi:peptide/nickel transport system permease protein